MTDEETQPKATAEDEDPETTNLKLLADIIKLSKRNSKSADVAKQGLLSIIHTITPKVDQNQVDDQVMSEKDYKHCRAYKVCEDIKRKYNIPKISITDLRMLANTIAKKRLGMNNPPTLKKKENLFKFFNDNVIIFEQDLTLYAERLKGTAK